MSRWVRIASAVLLIFAFMPAGSARARGGGGGQGGAGGIPVPTTFVLERVQGDPDALDQHVISFGVAQTTYSFVLKDAYTDGAGGESAWMTMWQQMRQFRPNLQIMGHNMFKLDAVKPGETVTIKGACAIGTRTFEILEIIPGDGYFAPPRHY